MINTIFFQWLNQSYNAGLTYYNKNSSCKYTNADIANGYAAAVSSAVMVGLGMRKITEPYIKTASGRKLLVLNTFVAATANSAASFCNTSFMRRAEVQKGINVCSDE